MQRSSAVLGFPEIRVTVYTLLLLRSKENIVF